MFESQGSGIRVQGTGVHYWVLSIEWPTPLPDVSSGTLDPQSFNGIICLSLRVQGSGSNTTLDPKVQNDMICLSARGQSQGSEVMGKGSGIRGKGSGVRDQGSGIRGQGLGAKCALTQGTYCTFDRKPWMASYLRVWRAELDIQYSIILPPTPLSLSTDSEKLKLFSTCQDTGL